MRYVTVKEMKELDGRAINQCGIPASSLMENAGKAIAAEATKTVKKGKVFVFCGYGNNGGDGFVVSRRLLIDGYLVKTFLVGNPRPLSSEAQANYQALVAVNHTPLVISGVKGIDEAFDGSPVPDLVVDAIFGIGIRGILGEFFLKLINRINSFDSPVIAADVPSGLDADTGKPLGSAIKASKTVTMGYPKIGFQNPAAKQYLGEVVCADIGLPELPCHSTAVAEESRR